MERFTWEELMEDGGEFRCDRIPNGLSLSVRIKNSQKFVRIKGGDDEMDFDIYQRGDEIRPYAKIREESRFGWCIWLDREELGSDFDLRNQIWYKTEPTTTKVNSQ